MKTEIVKGAKVTTYDFSDQPTELEQLESKYTEIEKAIAKLTEEKDAVKEKILGQFEAEFGHEGHSVICRPSGNTLQRVISITKNINDDLVHKVVTPEVWEKITVAKVVPDLFFSAIKMGDIVARDVADAVEDKEVQKLYVREPKKK